MAAASPSQPELIHGCLQLLISSIASLRSGCASCVHKVWYGYVERKILFISNDWLDWSRWSRQEFYRDTMPIRYWMQMGGTAFGSLLCLAGAIIG